MHADGVYVCGLEEQTMAPMTPRNHVLWPVTGGIPHFPTARKIDNVCQTGSCYDIKSCENSRANTVDQYSNYLKTQRSIHPSNTSQLCLPLHTAAPSVRQQWQERSSCQKRKRDEKREEGKAPTVNVTAEDNMHGTSCPCN